VVVPGVLLGRREPQGPRESSGQSGQRDNGLVQGQFRMGAEPVVREDNGTVGVRGIFGGRVVRHDDHPGRTAEEETVQTRLVLHRVLRQTFKKKVIKFVGGTRSFGKGSRGT